MSLDRLNPQARDFVSIGDAAFSNWPKPTLRWLSELQSASDTAIAQTNQSQQLRNKTVETQTPISVILQKDCAADVSDKTNASYAVLEDDKEDSLLPNNNSIHAAYSETCTLSLDQPQETNIQIKTIESLFPSGFILPGSLDPEIAFVIDNPLIAIQPFGTFPANHFFLNDCNLHNFDFINNRPERLYTKWLLWHLEISDHLIRSICPADLNNMPCEWDELPSGCPMLRLCAVKRFHCHPRRGLGYSDSAFLPGCEGEDRYSCIHIHDVAPNCRSINKQACLRNLSEQFRGIQLCHIVASQASKPASAWTEEDFCARGHDFEGVRLESVWRYWEHRAQARQRGSVGAVKYDRLGRSVFKPKRPDVNSLAHVQGAGEGALNDPGLDLDRARYVGRTFHGHYVKLSFELGERWLDGDYYTFRDLRRIGWYDGLRGGEEDAGEMGSDSGYATDGIELLA